MKTKTKLKQKENIMGKKIDTGKNIFFEDNETIVTNREKRY